MAAICRGGSRLGLYCISSHALKHDTLIQFTALSGWACSDWWVPLPRHLRTRKGIMRWDVGWGCGAGDMSWMAATLAYKFTRD